MRLEMSALVKKGSGNTFAQIAKAAAIVSTSVYAIGLIAAQFLPEPKEVTPE